MTTIMVLGVLIVGLLFLLAPRLSSANGHVDKKRRPAGKRSLRSRPVRRNPYQAVSVVPGRGACEAVRRLKGQTFLTDQAPLVPLADCGSDHCACKYRRVEDRRAPGGDRRAPFGLGSDLYAQNGREERRRRVGRRHADLQAA